MRNHTAGLESLPTGGTNSTVCHENKTKYLAIWAWKKKQNGLIWSKEVLKSETDVLKRHYYKSLTSRHRFSFSPFLTGIGGITKAWYGYIFIMILRQNKVTKTPKVSWVSEVRVSFAHDKGESYISFLRPPLWFRLTRRLIGILRRTCDKTVRIKAAFYTGEKPFVVSCLS